LGQALLAIAAIAGVVAAVANIALAATGEKSWTEAIISIVFAALGCVGLGGLRSVLGAVKGGAMLAKGGLPAFAAVFKTGATSIKTAAVTIKNLKIVSTTINEIKTMAARVTVQVMPEARALTGRTTLGWFSNNAVQLEALRSAKNLKAIEGYHDVVVHGTPTSVLGDVGEKLTAKQLADNILSKGQWDGKEAIRLVSCRTAAGPFAQQLANELGVPVLAPLDYIRVSNSGRILEVTGRRGEIKVAEMVTRYPQ